ncbi:MAG: iron(III) transport system substrate-binding protein [Verrucomicrobiales bacterium]
MTRFIVILLSLVAVISVPFLLKPEYEHDPRLADSPSQILNIITPHSESIRREFTTVFRRHMRETEGREVFIEWRVPGGTSEIEKILDTEFTFAFQHHWKDQLGGDWTPEVSAAFNNRRMSLPEDALNDTPSEQARRAFLDSEVGVGVDLFFGGGAYPFVTNSAKGYLVDAGLAAKHPDWFTEEIIPKEVGGEPFYDPSYRWLGCCLSTFGICVNDDVLKRLGVDAEMPNWDLLADPRLFKEVALADPTVSGTVTKAFEMILQQQMRRAVDTAEARGQTEEEALAEGWAVGLRLIQRIGANARYYANFSPKIPADVAIGNAAAGMCIDYYGRTYNELLRDEKGNSRLRFVTPLGGSSTSVDPIAMLRGAPNSELAFKFLEFLFSREGQKLWDYRAGADGGPVRQALRRMPVRKDLYQEPFLAYFADPDVMPFENADLFYYEAAWTARAFGAIRFIIKSMCLDPNEELQAAWAALIENDFPSEAVAVFENVERVNYDRALNEIADILKQPSRQQNLYGRDLSEHFRHQYRRVVSLSKP